MTRRNIVAAFAFVVCSLGWASAAGAASGPPLLLRQPTISADRLAFEYGGDIWIAPREGGAAHRLVTGYDLEGAPRFSPDGSLVAFSGNYDGHLDVYVVPATGGEPRRLTFHPNGSTVVGWTPDGKNVLFRSTQASPTDPDMLFTVPVGGGFPSRLQLPMGETGSYSPDGTHIAYVPNFRWEPFWKGYRGGQATPVFIADLATSNTIKIPRDGSNDDLPMWVGDTVYFLSDRDGPVTLFAYDISSKAVSRVLPPEGFDITSASAGPGAIVYEKFGALHLYDLKTRQSHPIEVTVAGDMPQIRPHWEKVGTRILNADISPTGVRAVFEAHGSIFTVPVEHGDVRNVGDGPSIENRDPAWSPDGRYIAYFSDQSGEYALHLRDQRALLPARSLRLGNPGYYSGLTWSPDSRKILYEDTRNNLWYLDIDHPDPVKVTTSAYGSGFQATWSPDSRWIVYADTLRNLLHAITLYNLDDGKSTRITDGGSDAQYPHFDPDGRLLYFTASTNTGLTPFGLDMVSDQHPVSSAVYAVVLSKDAGSPVKPPSDEEPVKAQEEPEHATPAPKPSATPTAAPKEENRTAIDFDGIGQRIVTLPIPEANFVQLNVGKTGELFLTVAPLASNEPGRPSFQVYDFNVPARKLTPFVSGVSAFGISANGAKALYEQAHKWYVVPTDRPVSPGGSALATDDMEVYVDPRAEWQQMYHEVWRIERDFFYDPHYHGLDLAAAERRFQPYVPGIVSRSDLTYLFEEMLSYLSVGHMFVRGGTQPMPPRVNTGLLGADYSIENGRYRFAKIYSSENWNPDLQAPLTQPGAQVRVGEYLLAVNGKALTSSDNLYTAFEETAGKQIVITVGPNPSLTGSRQLTVVPVANEFDLRNVNWIESNRRKVDELSGGKLAYVYLPDTGYDGFTDFNRYFFSQVGKEGVVIDERFNGGGQLADYVIQYLSRKPQSITVPRAGATLLDPPLAIFGPKVMVVNQFSGSGGDALPWYFRKANLGPIVGERTWGGLVGIGQYPQLMDGGTVTAPEFGIGGLHGQWEIENHGVAPDIEVWQDPELVRQGHDPQLEAAVKRALELLAEHPLPVYTAPPFPDHHPQLPPVP